MLNYQRVILVPYARYITLKSVWVRIGGWGLSVPKWEGAKAAATGKIQT